MTDRELIRAKIEEMMAEEMAIFKQAAKDGCTEESAAPVAYTRLQMLLAYIDSMDQAPVATYGLPQVSKAIEEVVVKNADTIFYNIIAGMVQSGFDRMRSNIIREVSDAMNRQY